MATLPTRYELHVATYLLSRCSELPCPREQQQAGYSSFASNGTFTSDTLARLEEPLLAAGLLGLTDEGHIFRTPAGTQVCAAHESGRELALLAAIVESHTPAWVQQLDDDLPVRAVVPSDDLDLFEKLFGDPEAARGFLGRGQQFDDTAQRELGLAGERHVVDEWGALLESAGASAEQTALLWHASLDDDTLGYDVVAPQLPTGAWRFEIKTCARHSSDWLQLYISRNEVRAGVADRWRLVVVEKAWDGSLHVAGHCRVSDIEHLLPADSYAAGRWETARLRVPRGLLSPGFPAVKT